MLSRKEKRELRAKLIELLDKLKQKDTSRKEKRQIRADLIDGIEKLKGEYEEKINPKAIQALEKLKTLLLNPKATEKEYKALLPDVEYIEEHEEEVEETDLYKEVIELLDNGLISMDSISLFDTVEG